MTDAAKDRIAGVFVALVMALGLIMAVAATSGCAWQKIAKTTLTSHEFAVEGADKTGLGYYERTCRDIATKCPPGSAATKACPDLIKCHTHRRLLQTILDKASLGISAAWTACAAGDQEGTQAKLKALVPILGTLSKLLAGIIPGGML